MPRPRHPAISWREAAVAEEFRLFLRTAAYIVIAGVAYWVVSLEPSGTVLLAALAAALLAFILVGRAFSHDRSSMGTGSLLARANAFIGFADRPDEPGPMENPPGLVPLASASPILSAGGAVLVGLGLVLGPWIGVPGLIVLLAGILGWLQPLDRT
jgi:hypothetical protein